MVFEERLLEKLFDLEGEIQMGDDSEFSFEVKGRAGLITIKLSGNKAKLYSQIPKWEQELEEVKELSSEDITELKRLGYEW